MWYLVSDLGSTSHPLTVVEYEVLVTGPPEKFPFLPLAGPRALKQAPGPLHLQNCSGSGGLPPYRHQRSAYEEKSVAMSFLREDFWYKPTTVSLRVFVFLQPAYDVVVHRAGEDQGEGASGFP